MEQKIDILVVEPVKAPYPASIGDSVEAAESCLGGTAELGCFLPQRVMLVSREDGKGLMPNRRMPGDGRCIRGTFLLCGIPEEGNRLISLSCRQREEFRRLFSKPGEFMTVGDAVYADPDDAAEAVYGLWDSLADGESLTVTKWGNAYAG